MALISCFAIKDGARRFVRDGVVGQSAEAAPGLQLFAEEMKKPTWRLRHAHPGDALAGRQDMSQMPSRSIQTLIDRWCEMCNEAIHAKKKNQYSDILRVWSDSTVC